jgi:hypothetical protein
VPASGPHGRVRTQWTGQVTLPVADDEPRPEPKRSRLPFVLGGALLAGGAAIAVVLLAGGGDPPSSEPPPVGSGSAVSQPAAGSQTATLTPDSAPAPPPLPAPPAEVIVRLDSRPRGAQIKDVASGRVLGKTPARLKMVGSHEPRTIALSKRGYSDAILEVVPNREHIEYTEKLERGASGTTVRRTVPDPGIKPAPESGSAATPADTGTPVTRPDGPVTRPDTPAAGSAASTGSAAKRPEEDCPGDDPCLKTNVPGLKVNIGGGSGGSAASSGSGSGS